MLIRDLQEVVEGNITKRPYRKASFMDIKKDRELNESLTKIRQDIDENKLMWRYTQDYEKPPFPLPKITKSSDTIPPKMKARITSLIADKNVDAEELFNTIELIWGNAYERGISTGQKIKSLDNGNNI